MIPSRPRKTSAEQRAAAFSLHCTGRPTYGNVRLLPRAQATRVVGAARTRVAGHPRRLASDGPTPTDRTFHEQSKPDFNDDTLITTVTAAATVARPFDEIVQLLDPRGWATRSELWLASYPVRFDRAGRVLFGTDGDPVIDEGTNQRSEWGKPWSGVLFEVTDWEVNEQTVSRFEVLLNIEFGIRQEPQRQLLLGYGSDETPINGRSFLHTYSLYQPLSGQLGYSAVDGGVEVDSGYAYAIECEWQGNPVTRVEVQKNVRYVDFTLGAGDDGPLDSGELFNYLAPGSIGVWIGSLVSEGLNAPL
ncbi:MAG TPA: hypothetical protein VHW01_05680 [Polyangiaceae bacterium]|nr:hypothetical protein [Polyangiaceae bacterium]